MSIISESSSYDQAISLISEMPFADKLRLNVDLASLLKKEGKSGVVGKAAKKEKKARDPNAPKKSAPLGTLAWIAFVKHCKDTMSERFTECTKEPERLAVCKAIKAEDAAVYTEFCEQFKADHSEDSIPSSPVAVAPAAKVVLTAKEKLEKLKAAKAAIPAPAKAAAVAKAEKPKKEAKKVAPVKKQVKKAETAPVAEEAAMPKKEIDGVEYWFDPETNGLYSVLDGGFGAWVGFFQPENDDEPIRRTESPNDE